MKEFFDKYKPTIISVLTAVLSLAVGLSSLDLGVKVGAIIAILVVVIPVLINMLTEGFNEHTVTLIVNAVSIIQKILVNNGVVGAAIVDDEGVDTFEVDDTATDEDIKEATTLILSKEEIREMLLENIK